MQLGFVSIGSVKVSVASGIRYLSTRIIQSGKLRRGAKHRKQTTNKNKANVLKTQMNPNQEILHRMETNTDNSQLSKMNKCFRNVCFCLKTQFENPHCLLDSGGYRSNIYSDSDRSLAVMTAWQNSVL